MGVLINLRVIQIELARLAAQLFLKLEMAGDHGRETNSGMTFTVLSKGW
jgi:hypothetical protein